MSRTNSMGSESFEEKRSDSCPNLRLLSHGRKRKPSNEKVVLAHIKGKSCLTIDARFGGWTLLRGNTVQIDMQVAPVECDAHRLLPFMQRNRKDIESAPVDEEKRAFRLKYPSTRALVSRGVRLSLLVLLGVVS
jgi:hypothetical protein